MEYHKIETVFDRDETTHKVIQGALRNPVYGIINPWEWTEKIDGTNIRIMWNPQHYASPSAMLRFGGKTDNAQIDAGLVAWLQDNVRVQLFKDVFPESSVVVYGEGYGPGIQKGGDYSHQKEFIVFDVLVDGKWWLNRENTEDVAKKLALKTVPFMGTNTLEQAVRFVKEGFNSRLAAAQTGRTRPAEGMVGRPIETLFDKKGHRIIVKLKTKDFPNA